MSHTEDEIRPQPVAWTGAPDLAPIEGLVFVGCGSSYHAAGLAAYGRAPVYPASEVLRRPALADGRTLVGLSRSGETPEVVRCRPAIAITCAAGSPLADAPSGVVLVGVDESSVVMTRSFTAMALTASRLAGAPLAVPAVVPFDEPTPDLDAVDEVVFLGGGRRFFLAAEGALKVREMARVRAVVYHPTEYLHGPKATSAGALVVILDDDPPSELDDVVEAEVTALGATVWRLTGPELAVVVRLQMLALRAAEGKGLDPDRPAGLSRVTRV